MSGVRVKNSEAKLVFTLTPYILTPYIRPQLKWRDFMLAKTSP